MYSKILMNLVGARKRYEMLEGKRHLVVPAVGLTEGVHIGSEGPLLYLGEEMSKDVCTWNYRPVVIDHPTLNGEGISACNPEVIDSQKVGNLFNSSYQGKFKTECWLDEDKMKLVKNGSQVLEAIDNGEMVEVSTGLFHEPELTTGTWKDGSAYKGIVRNIKPDHFAILPDSVGACSIDKGAGLLRNAAGEELSCDDVKEQIRCLLKGDSGKDEMCSPGSYCYICDLFPKYAVYEMGGAYYKVSYRLKGGKVSLTGEPEKVRKQTSYVTANGKLMTNDASEEPGYQTKFPQPSVDQLAEVMRRQQMESALKKLFNQEMEKGDWGGWITTLMANMVVFFKDGKLFRLPYTYDNDKIKFGTEPEEVEVETEPTYRTKTAQSPYNTNKGSTMPSTPTGNTIHQGAHEMVRQATGGLGSQHDQHSEKSDGQARSTAGGARKGEIDKLIGAGHAKEEDRKFLSDLPDDHFKSVKDWATRGAEQEIVPYTYDGIGDRSNVHSIHSGAGTMNKAPSLNEYIAQAPEEIRDALTGLVQSAQEEKDRLVKVIVANRANRFNEKWLAVQPIAQLKGMVALMGGAPKTPTRNFSGQASIPMFIDPPAIVDNEADEDISNGNPMPSWDSIAEPEPKTKAS